MKSLRHKIVLGYLTIILVNVLMVIFVIYHIHQLSQPINQILSEKYHNVNAAENMKQALAQQEAAQFAMIEEGLDSTLYYSFMTYRNEFLNAHQRAIAGIALPQEPDILDSLSAAFRTYLQNSRQLQAMIRHGVPYRQIKRFHYQNIFPMVKQIDSLCTTLKEVNLAAINQANLKAQKIASRTTQAILLFSAFLIILSILGSFYFTRRILQPIKATTDTVRKIGGGHLEQKINLESDDELGQLAKEFNRMTARLAMYEKMNIEQIILEKKKSEAIIKNIPSAIIVTDAQGQIKLMNQIALEIFNIKDHDYLNRSITDFISTDSFPEGPESLNRPQLITLHQPNHEGQDSYYQLHPIIIYDEQQQPQNMIFLLHDVTRFKELERLKSDFMATISHELKTPLTSLNMSVDILLKEVKGPLNRDQRELLQDAKADIQRLRDFVSELLEFSRLESGHYPLKWQPIEVEKLIGFACRPFDKWIRQRGIDFKINISPEVRSLWGDFQNLSRVISNILQNAIEHVPEKGKITLTVDLNKRNIRFAIQDNGPGIPLQARQIIFEKFTRSDTFETSKSGNVGLGLAIAREIVEKHGGKLWVESTLGKGSTFYFEIPVNQKHRSKPDV